ncbi:hypothetical protein HPB50_023134 [Hyalomma asiaticum]|uniref:Uncharacterized protein n=1 Tax=Hyalomma asiaticum TaxID=266040 RepID=A0ACB7RQJ9_HYAAI|nr:hypothetical protein HPB50_023134 [Hyalomma asiaticum]
MFLKKFDDKVLDLQLRVVWIVFLQVRRPLRALLSAPRPSTAGLGLVRSGGRPAPLRHGAAVLRSRQRPDAEISRLVRKTASTTVRQLHCEISDEVRSSADTMDQSSSIPQQTCAKRPNDATGDETPAPVAASGVASDVASKRPRQMRDAAIEAHSPGSPTTPSYKVIIKPRSCLDMSTLPNRAIQAAVDACLNTSRFQGFALHKPTNTISLWVHSLELVEKLNMLREIRTSQDDVLPVQAYLASGTDLRRYVVYGIDYNEEPENLRQELSCPTHKVIAARYLGRGRTCLVTTGSSQSTRPSAVLRLHVATKAIQAFRHILLLVLQARAYEFILPLPSQG